MSGLEAAVGGCGLGASPGRLMVVLSAVLVLVLVLIAACRRSRQPTGIRRRSAHALPVRLVWSVVMVEDIQLRLSREAARARAVQTRPPRDITVIARLAGVRGERRDERGAGPAPGAAPADD